VVAHRFFDIKNVISEICEQVEQIKAFQQSERDIKKQDCRED
jgi:hypothetical protein